MEDGSDDEDDDDDYEDDSPTTSSTGEVEMHLTRLISVTATAVSHRKMCGERSQK